MKQNIIPFVNKNMITEKVLQNIPEERKTAYRNNTPFRILLKFDSMDTESQNVLFDYLVQEAKKNEHFRKSDLVISLLGALEGTAWEAVESRADKYLIKGAKEWQEM